MNGIWRAYISGDERIRPFFGPRPGDWPAALEARDRAALTPLDDAALDEIARLNAQWGVAPAVVDKVERLRAPESRVIVTGQQPGLLAGPLYVLYKAIAAVRWAARAEAELGRPVMPVFWVASEDHDFEEVRSFRWRDAADAWRTYGYALQRYRPGMPIHDVPVEASLRDDLSRLFEEIKPTEFTEPLEEQLLALAAQSDNLESFFVRILAWLLGERAPLFVSPRMRWLRRRTAPILERELAHPGETSWRVFEAGQRLAALDFEPPLRRRLEDVNAFVYRDGVRHKIVADGGDEAFELVGPDDQRQQIARQALREELAGRPDGFSLNVVTRPIGQDFALPTLAFVAGPGEVAYLAQLREAYEFFGVPLPMILPRPQAYLIEPRVQRALDKLDLDLNALRDTTAEAFEASLRRQSQAPAVEADLAEARRRMDAALDFTKKKVDMADPAVAKAYEKMAGMLQTSFEKLAERHQRAALGRDEARRRSIATIRDSLWPDGILQERALTIFFPFLDLMGPGLIDHLIEALDLEARGIQPIAAATLAARKENA